MSGPTEQLQSASSVGVCDSVKQFFWIVIKLLWMIVLYK